MVTGKRFHVLVPPKYEHPMVAVAYSLSSIRALVFLEMSCWQHFSLSQ
jgi:hypothetical protein